MISSDQFCDVLEDQDVGFVSGVPCSYFSGPIERLSAQGVYVPAASEGAALTMAAGAALRGVRTAVIAQNSGLGNMINPLTSLLLTYRIPTLVFMSLRGWPDPADDEPQHAVMGSATHALLDALGVAHWTLYQDSTDLGGILAEAEKELAQGRPAFVLVQKGAVGKRSAPPQQGGAGRLTRAEALPLLLSKFSGLPVVSTTGYTSRELFAAGDADSHFYMQGSMGHASALGLGVALGAAHQDGGAGPVVVLDGDGAALMHLGTMSTIGSRAPIGLVHVLFDNGTYESTGAQPTTSGTVDFAAVARGLGYASARVCRTREEIEEGAEMMLRTTGPHFMVVPVGPIDGAVPNRATSSISAPALHARFASFMSAGATAEEDMCR
ncbi:phosphonopyruvate decarboxylase [Streptomyces sp. ME02-8801-2C]|uniref:phosphonopyruvate decarboxylase n=1 Tax=Streptomyces sp. ME02-8801-2C TaxID=3028680 RepID=UPI0029AE8F7D|nr:phosphonopyruvate decarboxylase [Streptomyces sp. ME02-8801-2C]MDX3458198.1 phosphonopyruvate decarboxylase [Streptomyces sp. ME02-8801-2C]